MNLFFFRKRRPKNEGLPQILGEALADNVLLLSSENEFSSFKGVIDTDDENKLKTEYLVLVMFLQTLACQIVFKEDKVLARDILDEYHQHVFRNSDRLKVEVPPNQPIHQTLEDRYAQYRNLLRTGEHNFDLGFLVQQLPYNFLANVLGRTVADVFKEPEIKSRYGLQTVELSVWVGEVLKEFIDRLTRAKEKI